MSGAIEQVVGQANEFVRSAVGVLSNAASATQSTVSSMAIAYGQIGNVAFAPVKIEPLPGLSTPSLANIDFNISPMGAPDPYTPNSIDVSQLDVDGAGDAVRSMADRAEGALGQLTLADAPTFTLEFDKEIPEISSVVIPVVPTLSLPTAPTISAIREVSVPTVDIPNLDLNETVDDRYYDSAVAATAGTFNDDVKQAVQAFLEDFGFKEQAGGLVLSGGADFANAVYTVDGGSPYKFLATALRNFHAKLTAYTDPSADAADKVLLDPNIEAQIHERAKAKIYAEGVAAQQQAITEFSKRGYSLPASVLSNALQAINQQILMSVAGQASELAINREKLETEYAYFVHKTLLEVRSSIANLALQYAQSVQTFFQMATAASGLVVQGFQALFDAYYKSFDVCAAVVRIQVEIWEMRIKAAMARYEQAKIEMELAKLTAEIDVTKVSVYKTQMEAELAKIEFYKGQIEGVIAQITVDKSRVDAYTAEVSAYSQRVNAFKTEVEAYNARNEAEIAKIRGYADIAGIHRIATETDSLQLERAVKKVDAELSINKDLREVFLAELQGYSTYMDAQVKESEVALTANRIQIEAYQANLQALIKNKELELENARMYLEAHKASMEAQVAKANGYGQAASTIASSNASLYGNVGSALASAAAGSFSMASAISVSALDAI